MDEEPMRDGVDGILYDRFALTIFTYICQHISNKQDAEDLLVEVFLASFKNEKLSRLLVARQLAWLLRVARNKPVDRHRHHALLTLVPIELASDEEDGAPTPEQYAEQQESYECLYQALEQLSPLQRELLWLRHTQSLHFCDIACKFEKSEVAVRQLYSRTLQQLRGIYLQTDGGKQDQSGRLVHLFNVLAAILVVAALLGASLLLFQHRLHSTAYHPTSLSQTSSRATAHITPTAKVTANSYGSFVATNGIMFGFDVQHTHFNPFEHILNPTTVGGLTKKWAYWTGSTVFSSPEVVGGVVYVGADNGTLYALDAASGAKKWIYRTSGTMFSPPTVANGVVYVGAGRDNVYALVAATGAKKWAYPIGGMDSSPAVADGVVYVGALGGDVYAFHLPGA